MRQVGGHYFQQHFPNSYGMLLHKYKDIERIGNGTVETLRNGFGEFFHELFKSHDMQNKLKTESFT